MWNSPSSRALIQSTSGYIHVGGVYVLGEGRLRTERGDGWSYKRTLSYSTLIYEILYQSIPVLNIEAHIYGIFVMK